MKNVSLVTVKKGNFTHEEFRDYMINSYMPKYEPEPYGYKKAKLEAIKTVKVALYERMNEVSQIRKLFKKDKDTDEVLKRRWGFLHNVYTLVEDEEVKVKVQLNESKS